jgi:hypothetical protein
MKTKKSPIRFSVIFADVFSVLSFPALSFEPISRLLITVLAHFET